MTDNHNRWDGLRDALGIEPDDTHWDELRDLWPPINDPHPDLNEFNMPNPFAGLDGTESISDEKLAELLANLLVTITEDDAVLAQAIADITGSTVDEVMAAVPIEDIHALHQSSDPVEWAQAFVKQVTQAPGLPTSEGGMIGWFANAMQTAIDMAAAEFMEYRVLETDRKILDESQIAALRLAPILNADDLKVLLDSHEALRKIATVFTPEPGEVVVALDTGHVGDPEVGVSKVIFDHADREDAASAAGEAYEMIDSYLHKQPGPKPGIDYEIPESWYQCYPIVSDDHRNISLYADAESTQHLGTFELSNNLERNVARGNEVLDGLRDIVEVRELLRTES